MKKYDWFVMNDDIDDWYVGIREEVIPHQLVIEILEEARLNNARTVLVDYCLLDSSINNGFSVFDNFKEAYEISMQYETLYGMRIHFVF